MVAIFFYVLQHRDSQIAYKILMSTKIYFKAFQIRGKNISSQLRQYGIDKVPTLYFPDKMAKVEGYQNIARYLGVELTIENQPVGQVRKKRKQKMPKLEPKYQKAIIESDSDEEDLEEEDIEEEEDLEEEDSDEEDIEEDIEEEEDIEDSDEISLEV
jgi:hypothetical protein